MDTHSFENLIYKNWTGHFGCPLETVHGSGTTLLPESKYNGDKLIVLWHIGNHTFAQFDPAYTSQLDRLIQTVPGKTALSGDLIREAWGADLIQTCDRGLTYYLFPSDLPDYTPPLPFNLRRLTETDAEAMSALHAANTPQDVDEASVEVTHQAAFGCFFEGTLTAAASGYERTGFLDIGVLTHPGFRKKGLGRAAVGGLCSWAQEHDLIAQYRHDLLNTGSQRTALSLNFRPYFKSEAITLG